jgi:hypothetical protein
MNNILVEICYANGGLYKEVYDSALGERSSETETESSVYTFNAGSPLAYHATSIKTDGLGEEVIKSYYPSTDFYKACNIEAINNCIDISEFTNLADVIELAVGIGMYPNTNSKFEIYFTVRDSENLSEIASAYSLNFPLPNNHDLDTNPELWQSYAMRAGMRRLNIRVAEERSNFKLGSIKFENNTPILLKMYKSNLKGQA